MKKNKTRNAVSRDEKKDLDEEVDRGRHPLLDDRIENGHQPVDGERLRSGEARRTQQFLQLKTKRMKTNTVEFGYIIHPRTGPKWLI